MDLQKLLPWGLDPFFTGQLDVEAPETQLLARVVAHHRGGYRLEGGDGPIWGILPGRLRHQIEDTELLPAVGDWVLAQPPEPGSPAVIERTLERKSQLVRTEAGTGKARAQVLAANLDRLLVVTSANRDFNPRRLERYLAAAYSGHIEPCIVVNKVDLDEERGPLEQALAAWGGRLSIHWVSAHSGEGLEALAAELESGKTLALVGSSGVGKSSLVNRLLGEDQQVVQAVRGDDDRGRHTTTAREIVRLANGALLMDTPGIRELGTWQANDGLTEVFSDIEALGRTCRFADCKHQGEPGCAIEAALARGEVDAGQVANFEKMQRELAFQARKVDAQAALAEQRRWRQIAKSHRQRTKHNEKVR